MAPAKRKAGAATQTASKKTQKTTAKGKGKAKRREIQVPVDDAFSECAGAEVFIGDDGTIYDASLNQTNIGDNNNKVRMTVEYLSNTNVFSSTFFNYSNASHVDSSTPTHDGEE
jgi:poly [ADP-ribose] polymerase